MAQQTRIISRLYQFAGGTLLLALLVIGMGIPLPPPFQALAPLSSEEQYLHGMAEYRAGNFGLAHDIWQPMAIAGDARAQLGIGHLYETGNGVSADPLAARRWYLAAASQANATAQYNLAMMDLSDADGMTNPDRAIDWLSRAAELGLPAAQHQLGLIYLDGQLRARDRQQARYWLQQAADSQWAPAQVQLTKLDSGSPVTSTPEHDHNLTYTGTGWPVASGYVVTNLHVVARASEVRLLRRDGTEIPATVVLRDELHDLALMRADNPAQLPPALPLASEDAGLGARVFTLGYPRVDLLGASPKLSEGVISGSQGLNADPFTYQISVPVQPGNSGGPLINRHGEVVGVVSAMFGVRTSGNRYETVAGINYARKAGLLHKLIPLLPVPREPIAQLPDTAADLETLAQRIEPSVMLVIAH